jgi:hypothetical protein
MSCDEFADVAAELALGVLTGRERADAVAHLETCDTCRETVRRLSMTGEDLAGLLPSAEPPAGFETRVLSRIGLAVPEPAPEPAPGPVPEPAPGPAPVPSRGRARGPARGLVRRYRKFLTVAAAILAIAAAGAGGWGLRAAAPAPAAVSGSAPVSALTAAPLLSAGHQRVGTVFYYRGSSRWMYMVVNLPSGAGSVGGIVTCQLAGPDGHYATVGSFRLTGGYGGWGGPDPGTEGQAVSARLVAASGTVIATARFS